MKLFKILIKVVFKKLKEKINLIVKSKDFKFFINNSNYNYNIYIFKIYLNTKLDLIKLEKK